MAIHSLKVVIAGGKGLVATSIVSGLLRSKTTTFDITVLSRTRIPPLFPVPSPHTLHFAKVNYANHADLVQLLHGTDAVISAVGQRQAIQVDDALLAAALETSVPRFFPNDFDADRTHPHVRETAESVYRERFAFMEKLEGLASAGRISWTIVTPAEFLDGEGSMEWLGFDVERRKATLYDGGVHVATGCTLGFLGDCFAAVLGDLELRNRRIRVAEVSYSGRELLALFEEVMGEKWTVVEDIISAESFRRAEEAQRSGNTHTAFLAQVLRMNYNGSGVANLVDGFAFMEVKTKRKTLREIVVDNICSVIPDFDVREE